MIADSLDMLADALAYAIGLAIGLYVLKEATEILGNARAARIDVVSP